MVFNATLNNISVLLMEEIGVPRENNRPVTDTDKFYKQILKLPYTSFPMKSISYIYVHVIQEFSMFILF
jgi:hypothetical protein